ncbi:MAG: GntR family transcriptional regulator [Solirubrobacterales bacterium]|jgi:DNA-binding GntR family transcriptional regulator|nr:GntR family transcriptional regulator [Solirubrobacterales bacterium]
MAKPTQPVRGRPKQSSTVPLARSSELDRNSDVPLYFQLAAALKVMLEVGTWEAGARFASERELEEEFKVSRAVIRPALDLLVGDGAIVRVKGSGAFVAPERREVQVAGLVRLSIERQDDLAITVLSARKRRPDHTVSHFLEIDDRRKPIAHVTAVVDVGHPSVFLVDSFFTVTHVPWLLPTAQALQEGTKPPKPSGLDLTRATVAVEHTFFGEWGSSQVGASAGDPALMGRFVQFGRAKGSKQERPLEFARLIYRADGAQLAFELS